jgi:lauroyl/myristoyl acyltransferase
MPPPTHKRSSSKTMVGFFLLGIYGRMVAYLPAWCVSLLCTLIAQAALLTSLRSRVERGMKRFPLKETYDRKDLAQRHIRFLVDVFHNMLCLRYHHRPQQGVGKRVTCEGEGYLKEALKDKGGVILVSLHLGNFFWSISYLADAYPTNLVVRGENSPRWEAFGMKMRQKVGIKTIYSQGGGLRIRESLRKGELVVFVIDQYLLPFFYGPDHPFREIVPRIAQIANAPVIPFYTLQDHGQIILRCLPPLQEVTPPGLEKMIMQGVKESPSQWFWWRRLGKVKRNHQTS